MTMYPSFDPVRKDASLHTNKIINSIIVVFILSSITKVFGFLRDVLLTNFLGVGIQTDAFYSVTILIEAIIVFSGLQAFFGFTTSSFSRLRVEKTSQHTINQFYTSYIAMAMVIAFFLTFLIAMIPQTFISMTLRGLSVEAQPITVRILKISAPMIIFSTLIRILASLLGVERMFVWQNVYLLAINIGSVATLIVMPKSDAIVFLALQIVIFNGIVCCAQVYLLATRGYTFTRLTRTIFLKNCGAIIPHILPLTLVTSFESIASIVERGIASFHQDGVITALSISQNLTYFTVSAIFVSMIRVIFPEFSQLYFSGKQKELSSLFNKAFSLSFFIFFPIAMFIVFFSRDIIAGLYYRKNFTAADVEMVGRLFSLYGFALLGNVYYQLPSFLLQSIQKNTIVGILGCISYSIVIVTSLILNKMYGYIGIPIGTFCGFLSYAVMLFIMIHKTIRISLNKNSIMVSGVVIVSTGIGLVTFTTINFDPSVFLSLPPYLSTIPVLLFRLLYFILVWLTGMMLLKLLRIPFSFSLKG